MGLAMWYERRLDKREPIKSDEVEFTEVERKRIFRLRQAMVPAVPDVKQVDRRLLGEEDDPYDEIFSVVSSDAATRRYERIRAKAKPRKIAAVLLATIVAGGVTGAAHLPLPRFQFTELDSCDWVLNPNEYVELASSSNINQQTDPQTCVLGNNTYIIHTQSTPNDIR